MTATVERTTLITAPFPTEPGIYEDIPEDLYHSSQDTLSSTGSRTLANKTPAHFAWEREHGRPPKTAFDIGTATHTTLFGRGADIVVIDAENYNRKAAQQERDAAYAEGKTPLLLPQAAQVDRMVAAVRKHRVAGKVFSRGDCRAEVTAVGVDPETGVTVRARIDWLLPIVPGQPIRFADAKTTDDASPAGMVKSMVQWGYPQQLDHYECTLRWALGLPDDYPVHAVLFGIEKNEPHLIGYGEPDEQAIAWAHEDNRRARHIYRRCQRDNDWPGYSENPVPLSLPGWRLNAYENTYPTGRYEPDHDIEGDHA